MGFERIDCTVPEFIDPVFAKTSPKRSFLMIENESFGLVFTKTGINSGTVVICTKPKFHPFRKGFSIKTDNPTSLFQSKKNPRKFVH